jgi:hypothetical protein
MTDNTFADRVRSVAEAFTVAGLARLTIRDGEFELEFRRSAADRAVAEAAVPVPSETLPAVEAVTIKPDVVTSDLVGVLRFSRPHVNEGHQL